VRARVTRDLHYLTVREVLWELLARVIRPACNHFVVRDKSPVCWLSLGAQSFRGNVAILVNESTNSAAEMGRPRAGETSSPQGRQKEAGVSPAYLALLRFTFFKALRSLYCESIRSIESIQSMQAGAASCCLSTWGNTRGGISHRTRRFRRLPLCILSNNSVGYSVIR